MELAKTQKAIVSKKVKQLVAKMELAKTQRAIVFPHESKNERLF
jgi:hypothetical protein